MKFFKKCSKRDISTVHTYIYIQLATQTTSTLCDTIIIISGYKFDGSGLNPQSTKLKSPQNFLALQYDETHTKHIQYIYMSVSINMKIICNMQTNLK